jgi:hypothetical protein
MLAKREHEAHEAEKESDLFAIPKDDPKIWFWF